MAFRHRMLFAVRALSRRRKTQPPIDAIDGWIVSPGGVATTAIIQHLSQFIATNADSDSDGLKHWPHPPQDWGTLEGKRVLFVSGEADVIYQSIMRRGWIEVQSAKLGCLTGVMATGELQRRAFIAAVEAQQSRWKAIRSENFRVISYEQIWDAAESLAAFFGIDDPRFVSEFPKRRARLTGADPSATEHRRAA